MAQTAGDVRIFSKGKVLTAPLGTAAPVEVGDVWVTAWIDHGFTTQDGLVLTPATTKYDTKAWQSDSPVRSRITERSHTWQAKLLQTGGLNTILYFGGGSWAPVTGHPTVFQYTPPVPGVDDNRMLGLEFVDGTITKRYIATIAIVSNVAAASIHGTSETQYDVTFSVDTDAWNILSNDQADNPASLAA